MHFHRKPAGLSLVQRRGVLWVVFFCASIVANVGPISPRVALAADPQFDFFERKIRPVLVAQCYECHSQAAEKENKLRGGLLLDSRDGLLRGGDTGPALVAGKPQESLLLQAIAYKGDTKMPPKGKLSDAAIADFTAWIKSGAPDPRVADSSPSAQPIKKQVGLSIEEGRNFWCYKPVEKPALPKVAANDWCVNDIDRFILSGLEQAKIEPAADADPLALIRRLSFDLTGLPPTVEEADAFVKDYAARPQQAFEALVDRLLASPAFGERWARHWLDVARYAESVTLRGFVFPEAWRYRDYVIDAFNRDLPYTRFVQEQLAGDLLPADMPGDRGRQIVATTFLMLGNTNLEEQDKKQLRMDVVDEMLDVIGKGFLAQTVTCARCHDHKFDPIPTRDYYALAGILRNVKAMEHANVSKWVEVPLPVDGPLEAELKAHEARIAELASKIKAAKSVAGNDETKRRVLAVKDIPGIVIDDTHAKKVGEWMTSVYNGTFIGDGYIHDKDMGKGEKTLTFQPETIESGTYEVRFAYSPGSNRTKTATVTVFRADGEKTFTIDMTRTPPLEGRYYSLGEYKFEKTGQSFVLVSNEGTRGHVTADAVVFLAANDLPPAKNAATNTTATNDKAAKNDGSKDTATAGNTDVSKSNKPLIDVKSLEAQLKKLQQNGPKRPMAMSVVEEPKIEDARIHIRGLVGSLGEIAPRGFLQVASAQPAASASVDAPAKVDMPANQSGRKQLAAWIASADNPLTSRVMVNRVWHWLFGAGLVRTVDNFGTTGEAPSHPELLDYLASQYVADGWSTKRLIRSIVLSRTYRLSSRVGPADNNNPATRDSNKPDGSNKPSRSNKPARSAKPSSTKFVATELDPENRLFGRANRKRLDAEEIRDAMLVIAGNLAPCSGGANFPEKLASDYGFKQTALCRSIYMPVFRNSLPEMFEAFDFADPSLVTGRRSTSTVAPQALFMLNNSFPIDQARRAAERLVKEPIRVDDSKKETNSQAVLAARVELAYRRTLGRMPTDDERKIAGDYVQRRTPELEAWSALFQALFASPDFRDLD